MSNSTVDEEAADWVTRLTDLGFDPDEPYPDLVARNNAFIQWADQSPEHLHAFRKFYDLHRRLHHFGARGAFRVDAKRFAQLLALAKATTDGGVSPETSSP